MSTMTSPSRERAQVRAQVRAPRAAAAAVERARLSLVPTGRMHAPRAPFAVLVLALLGAGVVGLLLFNTHMQQASFTATQLQQQADDLIARQQKLDMELQELRNPQRLAEAGRELGLVAPPVPAFISLADGRVLGVPTIATAEDSVKTKGRGPSLPAALDPPPIIVRVPAPTVADAADRGEESGAVDGPASAGNGAATGTNGTQAQEQVQTDRQGAQR